MQLFTDEKLVQQHIASSANIFGGVTGVGFNASQVRRTTFLMTTGVGSAGTGVMTVLASASASLTSPVAVPFKYKSQASSTTSDAYTPAAGYTAATAAGFTTAAGANQLFIIEVDSRDIPDGNTFIGLNSVQSAAGSVAGSCIAIGNEPMFVGQTPPSTFS